MKREIKFRALDLKEGYMSNVFSIDDASYEGFPRPFTDDNGECDIHAEYIVMQYTGLRDKNGVEIYEGDIVGSDRTEHTYEVKWDDEYTGFQFVTKDGVTLGYTANTCASITKVIGNIYQNKELLK